MQLRLKEDIFMQKTRNGVAVFGTLKVMSAVALMVAMSIVCGKYLAVGVGSVLRFSLENLPILLSGMLFGPAIGAFAGAAADLIGCFMVGYTVNPAVTLGAAAVGLVGGGVYKLLKKHTELVHAACVAFSVAAAHCIGSVLIKTVGLAVYYDMPFTLLLLWRLLNYTLVGAAEGVLLYYITKNRSVIALTERMKMKGSAK